MRNRLTRITLSRARSGFACDLSIHSNPANHTNSRTRVPILVQQAMSPRAGYFGLSPQRESFGKFGLISRACKKKKSASAKPSTTAPEYCGEYLTSAQLKLRYQIRSNTNFWELVKLQQIPRIILNQRKILFPREALLAWEAKRTIGSRRGGNVLG
jgi:hypothetical protein